MKIALDATALTITSGGLPRYVGELSRALSIAFPRDSFLLASDQPFRLTSDSAPNLRQLPGPAGWMERRWWLWGAERACKRAGVALFHGTNFAVPYFAKRPTVLSLHDLSPWMDPAWHHGAGRVRRHTPWMVKRATMVLTLTEAVRRQVIDYFKVPAGRVAAVPLAAPPEYLPVPEGSGRPYFLFVGTLEPRKNIPGLLEAWRLVRRSHAVDLVLAGRRRADFPELSAEPGLRILGEVEESRLPALYSHALALVYPSLYEGFGLPVLEAMQCGACVITSPDPAITEVAADAALYGSGTAEIAAAMGAVASDPALRASLQAKSLRRAAEFSWARTARLTYEVYQEAIARFGRS